MERDDIPVGYVLSRREALALIGAAGVATATGAVSLERAGRLLVAPTCVVRPAQIEGPYFVDEQMRRSDLRSDPATGVQREGVRLDLAFQVFRLGSEGCQPLVGAVVDLWQCDALGVYSDVRDTAGRFDTRGQTFLRGHQVTDEHGGARFTTIFPGWYQGRAVHIHFKIRAAILAGAAYEFTSQLYFEDSLTADVFSRQPYSARGTQWPRNSQDRFYRDSGGDQLTLDVQRTGATLAAAFGIGLQLA